MLAISRFQSQLTDFPIYVPPGRSGSSSSVPAYSGSSPESRLSGPFQNHKKIIVCGLRLTLRTAALFIKA
ncbi:hypothetical protein T11_1004 [Trichinella zimbabwensis]|uniref:Uncharacterized protein n=1 Tax=Trichinella zimbabwensis TaxID=268475 RepID=A0A0V1HXL3_9BILA|nr:hypothetical protein T11_1004 [Trichinella zimbabwensis]